MVNSICWPSLRQSIGSTTQYRFDVVGPRLDAVLSSYNASNLFIDDGNGVFQQNKRQSRRWGRFPLLSPVDRGRLKTHCVFFIVGQRNIFSNQFHDRNHWLLCVSRNIDSEWEIFFRKSNFCVFTQPGPIAGPLTTLVLSNWQFHYVVAVRRESGSRNQSF